MERFLVGDWVVAPQLGVLSRNDQSVRLRAKVIQLLVFFAEHPGEVLTKDDLLAGVWHAEAVSESALTRTITELRQALGDSPEHATFIETIPKRGYRLVAPVTVVTPTTPADLSATYQPAERRPVRWILPSLAAVIVIALLALLAPRFATNNASASLTFNARDWVLVTAFDNRTGNATLDDTIDSALQHALLASPHVNVVPAERVTEALRLMTRSATTVIDAAVGREIALRDGQIKFVISGSVEQLGQAHVINVRIVHPSTGETLESLRERAASVDDIPAAIAHLADALRQTLGETAPSLAAHPATLEKVTTPSLRAVRLYSDGRVAADGRKWAQAEALFAAALSEDAHFASARIWLAWCLRNLNRPASVYRAEATRAVAAVAAITDRERYFILASAAIMHDDYDRAIGQLEALMARYPDDYWGLKKLGELYQRTGNPSALDLYVRAAAAQSHNLTAVTTAAQLSMEMRGFEAARPALVRARALIGEAGPEGHSRQETYVVLSPVHELWLQRRIREASAQLDSLWADQQHSSDSGTLLYFASQRLALGQLQQAEEIINRLPGADLRHLWRAVLALAREDHAGMIEELREYAGADLAVISLLVRAGDLRLARRALDRLRPASPEQHAAWASLELQEAAGEHVAIDDGNRAGPRWIDVMSGIRSFMYSETLARALASEGDLASAIRVLEYTSTLRERLYTRASHNGYFWIRTRQQLADLYRRAGRAEDAVRVESELHELLVVADDNHPIVIALQAR